MMTSDWLLIGSLAVVVIVIGRHVPAVLQQMRDEPPEPQRKPINVNLDGGVKRARAYGQVILVALGAAGKAIIALVAPLGRFRPSIGRRTAKVQDAIFEPTPAAEPEVRISTEPTVQSADLAFERKRYKEAEQLYIKLCAANPKDARLYSKLGMVYMELKSFRDARDAFGQAIKLDPTVASRHVNLGIAQMQLEQPREALHAFSKALALQPENKKYQRLYELAKERR